MTDKEAFLSYYRQNPDIPLYYRPEWLDVVTGNDWDMACAYHEDGRLLAFMPVTKKKKMRVEAFTNPVLSPYQGIYFSEGDKEIKQQKRQSLIFKACRDILPRIGHPALFKVRFHPSFDMWLPFYFAGFRQTTYYSYILDNIRDHSHIFSGFKTNTRNIIRKAEQTLRVEERNDIASLYNLLGSTFEKKKMEVPFSLSFLEKLDKAVMPDRKLLFAVDENEKIHAAMFLVFDHDTAYNLLFGTDFSLVKSGAPSLLMWRAIQIASERVNRFDFEGSRLPGIQPFFQGFGGTPTPYYEISKAKNRFWQFVFSMAGKI